MTVIKEEKSQSFDLVFRKLSCSSALRSSNLKNLMFYHQQEQEDRTDQEIIEIVQKDTRCRANHHFDAIPISTEVTKLNS